MKKSLVLTRWIGDGSEDNPYQPALPKGYTSYRDVTNQRMSFGTPSPNIVLVEVVESREKHRGYVDNLKNDPRHTILDDVESARAYMKRHGYDGEELASADPEAVVRMCKGFERRKKQGGIERIRGMFYD